MTKTYCDICGVEVHESRRKTLAEIGEIIKGYDICPDCLTAAENVDWDEAIRKTIIDKNIKIPKAGKTN